MARYFLHLSNSVGYLRDDEGIDVTNSDEAGRIAAQTIRSMLSEEVKQGRFDLRGRIEIADDHGNTVRTVPFHEAIQMFTDGPA